MEVLEREEASPSATLLRVRGFGIKLKGVFIFLLIATAGGAYYYYVYRPSHLVQVVAYILPQSVEAVDSPAEVHTVVERLKNGDRVVVLARTRSWARVRSPAGGVGWIESRNLLDTDSFEAGRRLLQHLSSFPSQAVGHTTSEANLRLEPSRDAPQLAQLSQNQNVGVYGRRLVERTARSAEPSQPAAAAPGETASPAPGAPVRDAWYLVRADARAGWVMGRFVALDVPPEIGVYGADVNLVAWLRLNEVDDEGRKIPLYLVADRIGTQDVDFNHIRVFTWWPKKHVYATAYVESSLNGYFPIRVKPLNAVPYFRLRLVDEDGRKIQKVYEMLNTRVRVLGTVEGWESEAMPAQPVARTKGPR